MHPLNRFEPPGCGKHQDMTQAKDRSVERAAENETRFRDANEKLEERRTELELDGATPFICECEEETCTALVLLSAEEYEEIRSKSNRFVLSPGHTFRMGEVVAENGRFMTVDKQGKAAEIAEERDPR
jgi:hypothetical protein